MSNRNTTYPIRREKHSTANDLARGIYQSLGGPVAARALSLLEKGDFNQLVSLEVNPSDYSDIDLFRDDYLAAELMSKYPCWDTGIDKEQVALQKFLAAEESCAQARTRLNRSYGVASTTTSAASILYSASRKIARLLGPFSWDLAAQHFGWGPGATTQGPRSEGDAYYKFGYTKLDVTPECAVLAGCAIAQSPLWYCHIAGIQPGEPFAMPSPWLIARDHLTLCEGNSVTTVPKNAKTDRVIAIEPTMNMYIQKGIGGVIRRRLRRVGVDLNNQSLNQRLAQAGSKTGLLCTMDLSAASDSVSLRLVEELLPSDWVTAIKLCRSPVGVLPDGTKVTYQKVSSMGNGFTFELESLIFWALVSSVVDHHRGTERRISVYGDDLIFPVSVYSHVKDILTHCGFTVNEKKSFCYGYFRESCGKHFFDGYDVTPFYVREDVNTQMRLIWAANALSRYSQQRVPWVRDKRFEQTYQMVVSRIKRPFSIYRIPDGFGDGALLGSFDEARPNTVRAKGQVEGFTTSHFVPSPAYVRAIAESGSGALTLKSLSLGFQPEWWLTGSNPVLFRERTSGSSKPSARNIPNTKLTSTRVRLRRLLVTQWKDIGPWLYLD